MSRIAKPLTIFSIFILYLLCAIDIGSGESRQSKNNASLSIKLRARTTVLGPDVTLGDVSHILTRNRTIRARLLTIKIGHAPPPGESSEIKLSYIKRCLKMAGFTEYTKAIKGPRTIRVVTAQVEIDKAILKEEFAKFFKNNNSLACLEVPKNKKIDFMLNYLEYL